MLEQIFQGSGHSIKPVRVQGVSGQRSESYDLVLGHATRSRESDSVTLMDSFQFEVFYDSINIQINIKALR